MLKRVALCVAVCDLLTSCKSTAVKNELSEDAPLSEELLPAGYRLMGTAKEPVMETEVFGKKLWVTSMPPSSKWFEPVTVKQALEGCKVLNYNGQTGWTAPPCDYAAVLAGTGIHHIDAFNRMNSIHAWCQDSALDEQKERNFLEAWKMERASLLNGKSAGELSEKSKIKLSVLGQVIKESEIRLNPKMPKDVASIDMTKAEVSTREGKSGTVHDYEPIFQKEFAARSRNGGPIVQMSVTQKFQSSGGINYYPPGAEDGGLAPAVNYETEQLDAVSGWYCVKLAN